MPGLGKSNEHSRSHSSHSSGGHEGQSSSRGGGGSFSSHSHGGLGLGGGSFHGSSMSYGGGQTAHESFSHSTGGGGQSDSRTQQAIKEHTFSDMAATTNYGIKGQTGVGGLTGEGTLSDMWEGIKGLFKDDEYVTPTGAYKGYGFQAEDYERTTPFADRSLSEQWATDKMNTLGNLARNPFVSGALWASGLGMVDVGVQVADTIKDMVEGDIDTTKGLGRLASTAIASPLGAPLGKFRGIVSAGLEDVRNVPSAIAGLVGGTVGGQVAGGLAESMGANPYLSAGLFAVGTVGTATLSSKYAKEAIGAPISASPVPKAPKAGDGQQQQSSPLLANTQVQMPTTTQLPKPKKLDLPFYGTSLNQQLPMYGLAQVSPRRI